MAVQRRITLGLVLGGALAWAASARAEPAKALPIMQVHPQHIHDAAVAEVLRFYAPLGNPIDTAGWRVSIEDFEWQDAVYRIDLAVDAYPTLVPWNSAYVMAHRIWMTASGRAIQSEPIYDRPNLPEDVRTETLPASRRGFYPGNRHFAAQLDFLGTALQNAKVITVRMDRPLPGTALHYPFPRGTQDLADGRAEVEETATDYRVQMTPPADRGGTQLGDGYQLRFQVRKGTGQVTGATLILLTPPALM